MSYAPIRRGGTPDSCVAAGVLEELLHLAPQVLVVRLAPEKLGALLGRQRGRGLKQAPDLAPAIVAQGIRSASFARNRPSVKRANRIVPSSSRSASVGSTKRAAAGW